MKCLFKHKYQKIGENYITKIAFLKCKKCGNYIDVNESELSNYKLHGDYEFTRFMMFKIKIKHWFISKENRKKIYYKYKFWKLL